MTLVERMPCRTCGLLPFASREEWQADKARQEIGYAAQANHDLQPTYCMTCGRYQGLNVTGETRRRVEPWLVADSANTASAPRSESGQ